MLVHHDNVPTVLGYPRARIVRPFKGETGRQPRGQIVAVNLRTPAAIRREQQRVAIARALAGEPLFLLADEPTGNLDSLMARQVMQLLEEINQQGTTIIMVTHDAELARRAQRNIHIVDGQVSDYQQLQPVLEAAEA